MGNNRKANSNNQFQGEAPRILCVCSAGLLRSPTMAWVLGNAPWSCNTRAAGYNAEYALIPVDDVLIGWADGIICAEQKHVDAVIKIAAEAGVTPPPIVSLEIPDDFGFKDPALIGIIEHKLHEIGFDLTSM